MNDSARNHPAWKIPFYTRIKLIFAALKFCKDKKGGQYNPINKDFMTFLRQLGITPVQFSHIQENFQKQLSEAFDQSQLIILLAEIININFKDKPPVEWAVELLRNLELDPDLAKDELENALNITRDKDKRLIEQNQRKLKSELDSIVSQTVQLEAEIRTKFIEAGGFGRDLSLVEVLERIEEFPHCKYPVNSIPRVPMEDYAKAYFTKNILGHLMYWILNMNNDPYFREKRLSGKVLEIRSKQDNLRKLLQKASGLVICLAPIETPITESELVQSLHQLPKDQFAYVLHLLLKDKKIYKTLNVETGLSEFRVNPERRKRLEELRINESIGSYQD